MTSTITHIKDNLVFDGSAEGFIKNLIEDGRYHSIQLVDLKARVIDPENSSELEYSATAIGVRIDEVG